jgi:hypothetical protein
MNSVDPNDDCGRKSHMRRSSGTTFRSISWKEYNEIIDKIEKDRRSKMSWFERHRDGLHNLMWIAVIVGVVIALLAVVIVAATRPYCNTANGQGGVILSCNGKGITVDQNGQMVPYYYPMFIPYNQWATTSVYMNDNENDGFPSIARSSSSSYITTSSGERLDEVPIDESVSVEEAAGLPEGTVDLSSPSETSFSESSAGDVGGADDAGADAGGDAGAAVGGDD